MSDEQFFPDDENNPFDQFVPTEEMADMLESNLEQIETEGELMAKAIGSYYHELRQQGLPHELIAHLIINYQHNWLQ